MSAPLSQCTISYYYRVNKFSKQTIKRESKKRKVKKRDVSRAFLPTEKIAARCLKDNRFLQWDNGVMSKKSRLVCRDERVQKDAERPLPESDPMTGRTIIPSCSSKKIG